jgi:hypothetical protein
MFSDRRMSGPWDRTEGTREIIEFRAFTLLTAPSNSSGRISAHRRRQSAWHGGWRDPRLLRSLLSLVANRGTPSLRIRSISNHFTKISIAGE